MIGFLRNKRKKWLDLGKMRRYLLYALGEIILVVIGILLALQVNTWKEERNAQAIEKQILKGLLTEFQACHQEVKGDIGARNTILAVTRGFIEHHLNDQPIVLPADSLIVSFRNLTRYRFYTPTHPVLDDLQSSGRLDYIRSDSLRFLLMRYIQEKDRVSVMDELERLFAKNDIEPFISEHIDLIKLNHSPTDFQVVLHQLNSLQGQTTYGSMLHRRISATENALQYAVSLENVIEDIKSALENELQK